MGVTGAVTITQAVCDLLTRHYVFYKEPYQRSKAAFDRAKFKRDKVVAAQQEGGTSSSKKVNDSKAAKKVQRVEQDLSEAAADVARRHTAPSFFSSIVFLILYRILSFKYAGKVIAVLPFNAHWIIQKLSLRGLKFVDSFEESDNACAFAFIYLLSTMSVKFAVGKLLAYPAPLGADKGIVTLLDAPKSQKILNSFGLDSDDLKEA